MMSREETRKWMMTPSDREIHLYSMVFALFNIVE